MQRETNERPIRQFDNCFEHLKLMIQEDDDGLWLTWNLQELSEKNRLL